jgi:hypothetical protein
MENAEKYTFLLMRDDSSVRRLRVSQRLLKVLLTLVALVLVCGSVATWKGTNLWLENRQFQAEVQTLKQEISILHVRLERLSTYAQIWKNADPREMGDMLARISIIQEPPADAGDSTPPPRSAEAAEPASPQPGSAIVWADTLPPPVNEGQVALENFSARLVNANIELAYEMANLTASRVEGSLRIYIVTRNDELIPLSINRSAALFDMRSRKIVPRFTVPLPAQARGGAAVALMAEMLLGNHVSARSMHALPVVPE